MRRIFTALAALTTMLATSAGATEFEPRLTLDRPDPSARTVALTFDACAGGFDQRILDALVESEAKATIFVTERWLKNNAAAFAALKSRPDLFLIENHGAQHVPAVTDAPDVFGVKTARTIEAVRAEVEGGARAVERETGARPIWFRGATARYSDDALKVIAELGYKVAGYSLNADMGASLPAQAVARRMEAARSGDVVIAHINQPGRPAGEGVARGVHVLAADGVRFVRLDEVATKSDDGAPIPAARHKVEQQLGVERNGHGLDQRRDGGHPARGHERPRLGAARGEPDQRDTPEGQLKAEDDLAQRK